MRIGIYGSSIVIENIYIYGCWEGQGKTAVTGEGKTAIFAIEAKKSTVSEEANIKYVFIIKIVDIKSLFCHIL